MITGGAGIGLTATIVLLAALMHPFTVTVAEYVPEASVVALEIDGFCNEEENPFGPVHV